MRHIWALLLVCAGIAFAQSSEDPEVTIAKAELAKAKALVEAGALPKANLVKAEDALADAEDSAFLRKTAYGQELSLGQADEMIAAANRRLERRKKVLDEAQKLVEAGVATPRSLTTASEDVERARLEANLANSRADLTRQLAEMAEAEAAVATPATEAATDRYDGDGAMAFATYAKVEVAFEEHFGKKMPVSAAGETAVHRAMGFDHRGRVDVAIHPDQPEGVWLRDYLVSHHIPYFAFRHAVPGKATGAHIHIGPVSTKLDSGG